MPIIGLMGGLWGDREPPLGFNGKYEEHSVGSRKKRGNSESRKSHILSAGSRRQHTVATGEMPVASRANENLTAMNISNSGSLPIRFNNRKWTTGVRWRSYLLKIDDYLKRCRFLAF